MKINFLLSGIFRSGGMRVIFEYANRLTDKGHDIVMYFPIKPYNFNKNKSSFIYILKIYYWRLRELLFYKKTLKTIYRHKCKIKPVLLMNNMYIRDADVSIATQWPTAFSLEKLNINKGKKFYFIQGYEVWDSNSDLVNESYKLNLNRITISKYLSDLLLTKFGSDSEVIYNGIDLGLFNNTDKTFNKKIKTILYIDHYIESKNIAEGIKILSQIKEKHENLNIISFGYKKYNDNPDLITFVENPSDEEIKKLYSRSDIFIFTSIEEGFGLPPAEAMACKCAVVSTAVGAIPEYAENMETAILTDPKNPDELFKGISYLLENEAELKRISIAGYNRVREFFDWNKSVDLFEKTLLKEV